MTSETLFLDNREIIERAIAEIVRRHRLRDDDAEEFAAIARLHLVKDDYAVLKRFEGRSSFTAYLCTVIAHRYQDWRNATWGKWRPSAKAKRLGPLAIDLERLLGRDGLSFEQACVALRNAHGASAEPKALEEIRLALPERQKRRHVSDAELTHMAAPPAPFQTDAEREASRRLASDTAGAMAECVQGLAPQDSLIVRMHYQDAFAIADIARLLHLDQRPLYSRVQRILQMLRLCLQTKGIQAEAANEVLEQGGFDLLQADGDASGGKRASLSVFPMEQAISTPDSRGRIG